jgi:hypothetical protein
MMQGSGPWRCYQPCCQLSEAGGEIALKLEELEALRLVDLVGCDQETAAARMEVSRKTLWRDLHEARRKIADALVNGKKITVEGCEGRASGEECFKHPATDGNPEESSQS